jgi:hypothetical protein
MRSLETLMMAGIIGLVAVAIWQGRHWFPGQISSPGSAVAVAVQPASKGDPKALHLSPAKNSGRHSAARKNDPDRPGLPLVSPATDLSSPLTMVIGSSLGDPDSVKLPVGTTRSELRERFGTPTLDIQSPREGSLIERYYYVNQDHANMTVATLENGRLIATATVAR